MTSFDQILLDGFTVRFLIALCVVGGFVSLVYVFAAFYYLREAGAALRDCDEHPGLHWEPEQRRFANRLAAKSKRWAAFGFVALALNIACTLTLAFPLRVVQAREAAVVERAKAGAQRDADALRPQKEQDDAK